MTPDEALAHAAGTPSPHYRVTRGASALGMSCACCWDEIRLDQVVCDLPDESCAHEDCLIDEALKGLDEDAT
jgi:hypothetical protein